MDCGAQDEKKLRDALLFANGCGAITVTEKGAIPALPTKEAVLKILDGATANWSNYTCPHKNMIHCTTYVK